MFEWFILPKLIVVIATVVFVLTYVLYVEVLRKNMYLSMIVEIQQNQQVIDTGLYSVVRHSIYLSDILLFLSLPLVLSSLFSFLIFLIYPVIIVKRIKNEEQVLEQGLKWYSEYNKESKI